MSPKNEGLKALQVGAVTQASLPFLTAVVRGGLPRVAAPAPA